MKSSDLKTVKRFAKNHTEDPKHSLCVASHAGMLFDELSLYHHLGKNERRILCAAAFLHDIGWGKIGGLHNKVGMKFILQDKELPFSKRERIIIALIVRYHRGALPKKSHTLYGELSKKDRTLVQTLSGILRTADGLDASHAGTVKCVRISSDKKSFCLICFGEKTYEETHAAMKKSDLLAKTFQKNLKILWKKN